MLLLPLLPPLSRGQSLVFPLLLMARICRSIIINHVHRLDLKISLMRSYWGWHFVLLNPDTGWLILWWAVGEGLFFGYGPQGDCVLIPWPDRLRWNGCQVVRTLWKLVREARRPETWPQTPRECYDVIGRLGCFPTSKSDPKCAGVFWPGSLAGGEITNVTWFLSFYAPQFNENKL